MFTYSQLVLSIGMVTAIVCSDSRPSVVLALENQWWWLWPRLFVMGMMVQLVGGMGSRF